MKDILLTAIKKVLRVLVLGIGGGALIVYGLQYFFPDGWKKASKAVSANQKHAINQVELIGQYAIDQRLKDATQFTWDRVCLLKDYKWEGYIPEKQLQYASGYKIVYTPEKPLFVLNKQKDFQWLFLFTDSRTNEARWIDVCSNKRCIPISSLQDNEACFNDNVVLRPVHHMQKDNTAKLKYLLTAPDKNISDGEGKQTLIRVPYE